MEDVWVLLNIDDVLAVGDQANGPASRYSGTTWKPDYQWYDIVDSAGCPCWYWSDFKFRRKAQLDDDSLPESVSETRELVSTE